MCYFESTLDIICWNEDMFVHMAPTVLLLHLNPALKCLFWVLQFRLLGGSDGAVKTRLNNSSCACYRMSTSGNMYICPSEVKRGCPGGTLRKRQSANVKQEGLQSAPSALAPWNFYWLNDKSLEKICTSLAEATGHFSNHLFCV